MAPPRVRPPVDGDERAQLVGWLDLQRALVPFTCDGLADADEQADDAPRDRLLAECAAQCARSNEIVAAAALDAVCRNEEYCPGVHLRWVLTHLVEETARHVGHLDAIRELVDGRTGYY